MSNEDDFFEDINPQTHRDSQKGQGVRCQSCGRYFPISELRQCQHCGLIMCGECLSKHNCRNEEAQIQSQSAKSNTNSNVKSSQPVQNHSHKSIFDDKKKLGIIIGSIALIIAIVVTIVIVVNVTSPKEYTIKFVNYDGSNLQTLKYVEGSTPVYSGSTPTKASYGNYNYTFSGWSPLIRAVDGDATYTATYNDVLKEYTVKFVNYDGTVLRTSTFTVGSTPVYSGSTPTKASDGTYYYTFSGWSPSIHAVNGDATYTAVYSNAPTECTIKFVNYDGSVLQSSKFTVGSTPVYSGSTPTKASDSNYSYTFSGWNPSIHTVNGEETYTATYSSQTVNHAKSVGEKITFKSLLYSYQWSVDRVIRGSEAWNIIRTGNMFNSAPDSGYEYILMKVTAKNTSNDKESIYQSYWEVYANGVEDSEYRLTILPDSYKELESTTLMSGASTSGWIVHHVPINSNVKVYFSPSIVDSDDYVQL